MFTGQVFMDPIMARAGADIRPPTFLADTCGSHSRRTASSRPGRNFRNRLSHGACACFTRCVNVNLGIWSKLTNIVVGLVVLAVLLLIGMCYLPVIQENARMRGQISKLQAQLQIEEQKSKQLQGEIDALQTDPKTVERLAREKLGYARPDEAVIYFESTNEAR